MVGKMERTYHKTAVLTQHEDFSGSKVLVKANLFVSEFNSG